MRKKLICMILSIIMVCAFFSGCTLIEHNDAKDSQQVVATINPITETRKILDEDGKIVGEKNFASEKKTIYKYDLMLYLQQNSSEMMNTQGLTQNQAVDQSLKNLTIQQLLLIEADRLQAFGDIEWTQKQDNQVLENIYTTIDNQLVSIQNGILKNFKEEVPSTEQAEEAKTTFPIKPAETTEIDSQYYQYDASGSVIYLKNEDGSFKLDSKGEKIPDYLVWVPSLSRYPAMYGSIDTKSREGEAVRQFVAQLKTLVKDDFKTTKADKDAFAQDDKDIAAAMDKGIQYVYPMLGSTHYLEYLVGRSAKQSVQIGLLQKYITEGENVKVTNEEVKSAYDALLKEQTSSYDANPAAYDTDVSGGTVNVLYNKASSYFYVKHILLPFSAEQTAALTALKADPKNQASYKAIRDNQYVNETVVYPHVNGENDLSNPTTVQSVFEEVTSKMTQVQGNAYEAERMFDDLIYKYNTDPGVFDKAMGYAVKTKLADGEKGAYMEEFEAIARKLINEGNKPGTVYTEYAVTDYGVHIMYLANKVSAGSVNDLYSYQTPGKYKTYYQIFEDKIKTNKENAAFTDWQNTRITYYENKPKTIEKNLKAYKSLYTK